MLAVCDAVLLAVADCEVVCVMLGLWVRLAVVLGVCDWLEVGATDGDAV